MNYGDLCNLWYASMRGAGLAHRQIAVLQRELTESELVDLKVKYEGGEIKADKGEER